MATPPHRAILINGEAISICIFGNMVIIRNKPYPPSFKRIAAKTIDPAIGASTWALGNHRWTENIGSFTRKPARASSQNPEVIDSSVGKTNSDDIDIRLWCDEE